MHPFASKNLVWYTWGMKKKTVKKYSDNTKSFLAKQATESRFWQQIALKQQIFLHAKNNT
jgi:hypothetical protein